MLFVFVMKYTPLAYKGVPPVTVAERALPCGGTAPEVGGCHPKQSTEADRSDAPVECCSSNR
jgi:hypothetical protein